LEDDYQNRKRPSNIRQEHRGTTNEEQNNLGIHLFFVMLEQSFFSAMGQNDRQKRIRTGKIRDKKKRKKHC
jgi:hypothetical protein